MIFINMIYGKGKSESSIGLPKFSHLVCARTETQKQVGQFFLWYQQRPWRVSNTKIRRWENKLYRQIANVSPWCFSQPTHLLVLLPLSPCGFCDFGFHSGAHWVTHISLSHSGSTGDEGERNRGISRDKLNKRDSFTYIAYEKKWQLELNARVSWGDRYFEF